MMDIAEQSRANAFGATWLKLITLFNIRIECTRVKLRFKKTISLCDSCEA